MGPISDISYEDNIEILDDDNQSVGQYINEIKLLKEKVELLEEEINELERKLYSSNDNFSNYLYKVFNPFFIHEGDKVLEYVVTMIEESDRHRAVEFSGELTVKLVISKRLDYTDAYDFKLS